MSYEIIKKKVGNDIFYGYYAKDGSFLFHCEDGPAIVHADGKKLWYKHNKKHREDGPAIIYFDELTDYWIIGKQVTDKVNKWLNERNIDENNMSDEDKLALTFFMRSLI